MKALENLVEWWKHRLPGGWAHRVETAEYSTTVGYTTYHQTVLIHLFSSKRDGAPIAIRLSHPKSQLSLLLTSECALDLADRLIRAADEIST